MVEQARLRTSKPGPGWASVQRAAALREIAPGLQVERISIGILPSPFAGLGRNVLAGIARCAGQATPAGPGGQAATPLLDRRWMTAAPPGAAPLRPRLTSFVQWLPCDAAGLPDAWAGAGTVPECLHRGLNGLASLVRWRLLRSLTPFT